MRRRSVLQAVAAVAASPSLGAAGSDAESGTVYDRLGVKLLIIVIGSVLHETMTSLFDRPGRPSGRRTPARLPGLSARPPVPS